MPLKCKRHITEIERIIDFNEDLPLISLFNHTNKYFGSNIIWDSNSDYFVNE